jgi:hypothetical protein
VFTYFCDVHPPADARHGSRCRRDRTTYPHTELTPRCRRAQDASGHSPELWRHSPWSCWSCW